MVSMTNYFVSDHMKHPVLQTYVDEQQFSRIKTMLIRTLLHRVFISLNQPNHGV